MLASRPVHGSTPDRKYASPLITRKTLIRDKPDPTDADIDSAMSDSVCRCGTYQRVRRAIHRAARDGKRT